MCRVALTCSAAALLVFTSCSGSDSDSSASSSESGSDSDVSAPSSPGGVITIDGVDYPFDAEGCLDNFGQITTGGLGTTADGTVYYAALSYSFNIRNSELDPPGMLSDEEVETAIASGDIDEDISVVVDLGRDDVLASSPDDQPSYRAARAFGSDVEGAVESWEFADGVFSGSGSVIDQNGVALPAGSTTPVEFVATCE